MIGQARYGFELIPITWGPQTVPSAGATVFDISDWNLNLDTNPDTIKIIWIEQLAMTQNSQIQYILEYDNQSTDPAQGWTDAMPGNVNPLQYPMRMFAAARMKLSLVNTSGAAVDSFQLNFSLAVLTLSAADKLRLGYALSEPETMLLNEWGTQQGMPPLEALRSLVTKGTRPMSTAAQIISTWENEHVPDRTSDVPWHILVGAGLSVSATKAVNVPPGAVMVVRGFAFEGGATAVHTFNRDGTGGGTDPSDYVAVNGGAFVNGHDLPFASWLPVARYFNFATYAAAATYPVRLETSLFTLSQLLAVRLGLTTKPRDLYVKVKLGVM